MTGGGLLDARILVVDDEESNVRLLEVLLGQWGYENVTSTTRSAKVPALFERTDPDLLLLDLSMPQPDGFELLELLGPAARNGTFLPVLVLTADITREARERALTLGASDFLLKPFDPIEVRLRIGNLLETRRLSIELTRHNAALERRVRARTQELDHARLETLERLALAAEYRDDTTHEHAERVGRTSALLAEAFGLAPEETAAIRRAAPLHDVGKIGVPDAILLKEARLTAEETAVMEQHTTIGAQILAGSGSHVLQLAEVIALGHHERWDGTGYPHGLAGDAIPLPARLTAIADVFDALTHARPYKAAWAVADAVAEIVRLAGTQFDPELVELFIALDVESLLEPVRDRPDSSVTAPVQESAGSRVSQDDVHELLNLLGAVLANTQLAIWTEPSHPARDRLDELKEAATAAVELLRRP